MLKFLSQGNANMPNPIAHPAASIPFTKIGLVFSALVFGSIAPDFGYFFDLPSSYFMYTPSGLFLFDLPVGLVMLWLFHALLKWPLLSLLPDRLQRRLYKHAQGFSFGPLKRFGMILLSLLVGSLTHVIWDSFTHDYGWVVERFAFFNMVIGGTPLYAILQNLSTLIGIGILIFWFIRWLPAAPQSEQLLAHFSGKVRAVFLALAVVSLAAVEGAIIYLRLMTGSRFVHEHFFWGSITFSTVIIITFFVGVYCVTWMLAFHKSLRRPN
jgi:hypothetical protein